MSKDKKLYEDCTTVSIPVPYLLHRELKLYCLNHNLTIKEVLHNISTKGIKELIEKDKKDK
jgi:hypothetical protein